MSIGNLETGGRAAEKHKETKTTEKGSKQFQAVPSLLRVGG
jgi:hypothetical protein